MITSRRDRLENTTDCAEIRNIALLGPSSNLVQPADGGC
jgi:hypothetical protein